jgi:hypothetical protein
MNTTQKQFSLNGEASKKQSPVKVVESGSGRSRPPLRVSRWAGLCMAGGLLFLAANSRSATVVAGPDETGLRTAIASAQDGDTVLLVNSVALESSVRLDKRLTFRFSGDPFSVAVRGSFEGALFQIVTNGVAFEGLRFIGSPQTDGLAVEADVVLRDCLIDYTRRPVAADYWIAPFATVRLERVQVVHNDEGLEAVNLEAKDSVFASNGGSAGAGAQSGWLENCRFENNQGTGLFLLNGTVKGCVFRHNGELGVWFDPDPGFLGLSDSLFYANGQGGILLREEAVAVIDNCTFTRHTGLPAISITEAHDVLLRHCTVVDNMVIEPEFWPWWPVSGAIALGYNGKVELQNCLVADNPINDDPYAANIAGSWVNGGGNVLGGPAKLSTLRDNGGPTLTLLPLPGSPAIDAGRAGDVVRDARGLSRQADRFPDAGAVESDASALADTDSDGAPDNWELFHGLNPTDPADAALDSDGDGRTALDEYGARTDPADAQSVLRIERFGFAPDYWGLPARAIELVWTRVPGVSYQVESSTDLRTWRKAGGSIAIGGIFALRFNGPAENPMSFYRVKPVESLDD